MSALRAPAVAPVAPGADSVVVELVVIVEVSEVVQTALAAHVLSETRVDRQGLGIGNS